LVTTALRPCNNEGECTCSPTALLVLLDPSGNLGLLLL
jgi:hypothetical protein